MGSQFVLVKLDEDAPIKYKSKQIRIYCKDKEKYNMEMIIDQNDDLKNNDDRDIDDYSLTIENNSGTDIFIGLYQWLLYYQISVSWGHSKEGLILKPKKIVDVNPGDRNKLEWDVEIFGDEYLKKNQLVRKGWTMDE